MNRKMASPVIVYIRRLEKGTNIAGRRPTPKPSLWHTNGDWSNQDLYAREIYVNTAEGKAFITNDTDIFNLARDDGQHDYVSANTLALEDVFFHKITNVSNEIRLINNFIETYFKWRGGSSIVLEVLAGETVKHMYAAYNNAKPIKLSSNSDFTAVKDVLLQLVYDENNEVWKEIGSTSFSDNFATQVGDSIVKFDHHTHIVTQTEAEGGNFTFEVPNVIAKNMGIHVYCNQLPLTLNKGYSVDLESETSKEVTILKNNADETYFAIKTGWPIFVGYYYKVAVPGTPENPPEPLSMVTLDSVTHESPDNPEEEYNAANDVKFILHFSNTGSAAESLNLTLALTHVENGALVNTQNITHSVPAGGNTYEMIYRSLGDSGGNNTYTLTVTGDRTGTDSVTVPALTPDWDCFIHSATRETTDTVFCVVKVKNIGSVIGNKLVFLQFDSGTKIFRNALNVRPGEDFIIQQTFTGVDANAHTITLYDSDGTTVLDTWEVAASGTAVITTALNTWVKATGYTAAGVFKFNGAWAQSIDWNALELGIGGSYVDAINRSQVKILDVPNIASLSTVVLRFIPINGYEPSNTNFAALQVHVHNKDLRLSQTYYDYHYNYINNNIVLSTQIIPNSDLGNTEYRVTLDGNYFENIADGYKGLLFRFTDETTPGTFTYLRLRQVQYIP